MSTSTLWMNMLASDEGYRRKMDIGPEGSMVIGYGVRLDRGLNQQEARALFEARCRTIWHELYSKRPVVLDCPPQIQGVLFNLGYTLTVLEILRRKKIWTLLRNRQFHLLPNEILRMGIATSQPDRASRLATKCRLSITRIQNNWNSLREGLFKKRIDLDEQPHRIQIALAQVLDGTEVMAMLEYSEIWKAIKKEDYMQASREIVECPYLHLLELNHSLIKDIPLNHIRANLKQEDPAYIKFLNSHNSTLPSQHLVHGQAVPIY